MFSIIPIIAAKLIPVRENVTSPSLNEIMAPPSPKTSIVDIIIMFFILLKSTLFSNNTFNPFTDINP